MGNSLGGTAETPVSRPGPTSAEAVAEAIARLEALSTQALRIEWRRLHRTDPPASLSRDLLRRALACTLQERAYGGLS